MQEQHTKPLKYVDNNRNRICYIYHTAYQRWPQSVFFRAVALIPKSENGKGRCVCLGGKICSIYIYLSSFKIIGKFVRARRTCGKIVFFSRKFAYSSSCCNSKNKQKRFCFRLLKGAKAFMTWSKDKQHF